jgi:hypothetical protein
MKSILRACGVIILTFVVTSAFAQQRGGGMRNMDPEEKAKQQVTTMKEIVEINEKETEQVQELFLKYAKEQQKLQQEMRDGGDRASMRPKMTEMNTKRNAELEKVLGKERLKKYTDEMEKRAQERTRR